MLVHPFNQQQSGKEAVDLDLWIGGQSDLHNEFWASQGPHSDEVSKKKKVRK